MLFIILFIYLFFKSKHILSLHYKKKFIILKRYSKTEKITDL